MAVREQGGHCQGPPPFPGESPRSRPAPPVGRAARIRQCPLLPGMGNRHGPSLQPHEVVRLRRRTDPDQELPCSPRERLPGEGLQPWLILHPTRGAGQLQGGWRPTTLHGETSAHVIDTDSTPAMGDLQEAETGGVGEVSSWRRGRRPGGGPWQRGVHQRARRTIFPEGSGPGLIRTPRTPPPPPNAEWSGARGNPGFHAATAAKRAGGPLGTEAQTGCPAVLDGLTRTHRNPRGLHESPRMSRVPREAAGDVSSGAKGQAGSWVPNDVGVEERAWEAAEMGRGGFVGTDPRESCSSTRAILPLWTQAGLVRRRPGLSGVCRGSPQEIGRPFVISHSPEDPDHLRGRHRASSNMIVRPLPGDTDPSGPGQGQRQLAPGDHWPSAFPSTRGGLPTSLKRAALVSPSGPLLSWRSPMPVHGGAPCGDLAPAPGACCALDPAAQSEVHALRGGGARRLAASSGPSIGRNRNGRAGHPCPGRELAMQRTWLMERTPSSGGDRGRPR